MSDIECPVCGGTDHMIGTSIRQKMYLPFARHKDDLSKNDLTVTTTAFRCKACGCEFKASRTMDSQPWVVLPYVFDVKKKRLSADQPKLAWR